MRSMVAGVRNIIALKCKNLSVFSSFNIPRLSLIIVLMKRLNLGLR